MRNIKPVKKYTTALSAIVFILALFSPQAAEAATSKPKLAKVISYLQTAQKQTADKLSSTPFSLTFSDKTGKNNNAVKLVLDSKFNASYYENNKLLNMLYQGTLYAKKENITLMSYDKEIIKKLNLNENASWFMVNPTLLDTSATKDTLLDDFVASALDYFNLTDIASINESKYSITMTTSGNSKLILLSPKSKNDPSYTVRITGGILNYYYSKIGTRSKTTTLTDKNITSAKVPSGAILDYSLVLSDPDYLPLKSLNYATFVWDTILSKAKSIAVDNGRDTNSVTQADLAQALTELEISAATLYNGGVEINSTITPTPTSYCFKINPITQLTKSTCLQLGLVKP